MWHISSNFNKYQLFTAQTGTVRSTVDSQRKGHSFTLTIICISAPCSHMDTFLYDRPLTCMSRLHGGLCSQTVISGAPWPIQ